MNINDPIETTQMISRLTTLNRRLTYVFGVLFFVWLATLVLLMLDRRAAAHAMSSNDALRVRSITVIDDHGVERVKIGAPLPDPVTLGKRGRRDDSISGILIYDSRGNERGGYVTDNSVGNAFLTLDSDRMQQITLVAYPGGGAEIGIQNEKKDSTALSAVDSGPKVKLIRHAETIYQQPAE
jgi:hypothetical protein